MRLNRPWFYILILLIAITVLFKQRANIVSFGLTQYLKYPIKFGSFNWLPKKNRLDISNLQLGPHASSDDCHLAFDLPEIKSDLHLENIKLRLGKVVINTTLDVLKQSEQQVWIRAKGSSKQGPINDVLACLNLKEDELLAEFELPKFDVSLVLEQGKPLLDSIHGSGNVILHNGKFKLIDIVKPVVCKFACKDDKEPDLKDSRSFDVLTADFAIADQLIKVKNIKFKNFYTKAKGKGKIGFDSQINFDLYLAGLDSYLPIEQLKLDYLLPQGLMPIKITGTAQKPIVFPNPASLPQSLKPKLFDKLFDWWGSN